MKKIGRIILSLIIVMFSTILFLAGCDEYRKLTISLDKSEVVVYLNSDPEENIFSVSATISGNNKNVSTDVLFEVYSTQGVIEQYGSPTKSGTTTTMLYIAKKQGKADIYVTTKEGNKQKKCTVNVEEPVTDIGFSQTSFAINRGVEKDFSSFVSYTPLHTSQRGFSFLAVNANVEGELGLIQITDGKILVPNSSTLTSFVLKVTSNANAELYKNITVNVVDTVDTLEVYYKDASLTDYEEVTKTNNTYSLTLAQNVNEEAYFKKFIKLRGYAINGTVDKGFIGEDDNYVVSMYVLNSTTNEYQLVSLPYVGDYFEVSKQTSDKSIQISQLMKGNGVVKFVVDYAGHEGEFTQEIVLNIRVIGLPTIIEAIYSGVVVDKITLFDKSSASTSVEGTNIDLNVFGVNNEVLNDEPVILSFESESEVKVSVYNRYGVLLNLANPITVNNDCPLLISHDYTTDETAPEDLILKITSYNYDKVFTSVEVNFIRGEINLGINSTYKVSTTDSGKEIEIDGLPLSFNKSLLSVYIGNTNIVKINETLLLEENRLVLVPQGIVGSTTFYIVAPNKKQSRVATITVFEELQNNSTITVYGVVISPSVVDPSVKELVLKTNNTYSVNYNINNKYNYLITGMTSVISSSSTEIVKVVEGNLKTQLKTGSVNIVLKLTGYDIAGELVKELEYKFTIIVKAPLVSAKPSSYVETIYNLNQVVGYEDALAKRTIQFSVNPTNATFTKEDMQWVVKVGDSFLDLFATEYYDNNGIKLDISNPSNLSKVYKTTYLYEYNGSLIYIETLANSLYKSTVYSKVSDAVDSLVFAVVCRISQTFVNEKGVETTITNEDVNVTFTAKQPVKVSNIILNNINMIEVDNGDGTNIIKNSLTFDTRKMEIAQNGIYTSGNVYEVNYSILPVNSTVQDLIVSHTQALSDLEVSIDTTNKKIIIRVNRQLDGETIISIRAKDGINYFVEQQLYLKITDGTLQNPFEVGDASDFNEIRYSLNSHYVLTADINLNGYTAWEPIGTATNPFTGSINASHKIFIEDRYVNVLHRVYNLNIVLLQGDSTGNINYFGLFGYIGETGAVLNLSLSNVKINIMDTNNGENVYIGAIAGFSKGLIYNSSVKDNSNISGSSVTSMFTDASKTAGINYKALGTSKFVYVGGLVGMLIGMNDLATNFNVTNDNADLIYDLESSFENNSSFISIIATSNVESSSIIAGGLVGYNFGATITTNSNELSVISSVNSISGANSTNVDSIFGGVVGINFGTLENYYVKSYVKGLNYVGGAVGINIGTIENVTILPIIRGNNNVGGLIGVNYYNTNLSYSTLMTNIVPIQMYEITEENDVVISSIFAIQNSFYDTLLRNVTYNETLRVITLNINANSLVNSNKVQFIDKEERTSIYNTGIIGKENVGGLIGASFQSATVVSGVNKQFLIDNVISNNSVYSYFNLENRKIYNYNATNTDNRYFGDIVVVDGAINNIGGLIGYATHSYISKAFVNVNITASNIGENNIGGLFGSVGQDIVDSIGNGILVIKDSHTNGVVNTIIESGTYNIGSFIGDGTKLYERDFENIDGIFLNDLGNGEKAYTLSSSYSILRKSSNNSTGYVSTTVFVNGFSGTDTFLTYTRSFVYGESSYDVSVPFDNIVAINSFYIGFTINYIESSPNTFNTSVDLSSYSTSDIKVYTFTYENALKGYDEIFNFSYYNLPYNELNYYVYTNYKNSAWVYTYDEDVITEMSYTNISSSSVNQELYRFVIYNIELENDDEDGFGVDTEVVNDENVINVKYNWYRNNYEYVNESNKNEKYRAYSGLPISLNTIVNVGVQYSNQLNFVFNIPPMGIGVEFIDSENTYIREIEIGGVTQDEIVLTFTQLDSKYYNSDGTISSFNNYTEFDRISYSNNIKANILKANTYLLKDTIDINALPKFVSKSNLTFKSLNGKLIFDYDAYGNETIVVIGSGEDQILITSAYNKDVTYIARVNIISEVSKLILQKNKRTSDEINTIEIVKNVETALFGNIVSQYSQILNSVSYSFDLVQSQNLGTRFYFTNRVNNSLSIYFDNDSTTTDLVINGIEDVVCESVEVNGETKYVYYVDVVSSEFSLLGRNSTEDYISTIAVPYIVLNNDNFFMVENSDVEDIANSFSQETNTFGLSNDYIKPLRIKVINETFNIRTDKTSIEFSAYTQPSINVTLETDNSEEKLYYVISSGYKYTAENMVYNTNKISTLDDLQVFASIPSYDEILRLKTFNFEFSVVKENGLYQSTIENTESFTISFYTKAGEEVSLLKRCYVNIIPQPVNEISILHYPSGEYEESELNGQIVYSPKTNEVAYDNIIPGYMGILKINLSPYYASVSSVNITSNIVNGTMVSFEQLVYLEDAASGTFKYVSAYPQSSAITNGIIALKRSYLSDDSYVYDGNLYIRTILPSSALSGSDFVITVTVFGYANGELITYTPKTISLEAITPPGLYISYKNSTYGVIARGTSVDVNITGDGLDNTSIDFNTYTYISIYNGGTEYGIGGRVKISKISSSVYSVTASSDLPQGSTIHLIGHFERTINSKVYIAKAELTLKVANFVIESITVENVYEGKYEAKLNQSSKLVVVVNSALYNPYISGVVNSLKLFTTQLSNLINSTNGITSTWYQRVYNTNGSFSDSNLIPNDYGTFVISQNDNGEVFIRNTVKSSNHILVAKAVINYSFTNGTITMGEPSGATLPDGMMDETYTVELECEFGFDITRNPENFPEPISTTEQFLGMEEGVEYILMNDIVLTNYRPMSTAIGSLDGNGYVITIKSFDTSVITDEEGNETGTTNSISVGLFSTVSADTILNNITLEIVPLSTVYGVVESKGDGTPDLLVDVSRYSNITFGFIAATNNGTITNAQVVNDTLANEIREERENTLEAYYANKGESYTKNSYTNVSGRSISILKIEVGSSFNSAYIGGLVGINNGYISNSRVENITINGIGYVAGIAVYNYQTISSTYYKGANLLNQSSYSIEDAYTAGLVVFNEMGATIQYSYTMSREGWKYDLEISDEDDKKTEGSVSHIDLDMSTSDRLEYSDITGISTTEKNMFTGVYNKNTLVVQDIYGNAIDKTTNQAVYDNAFTYLKNNSDIMMLRAVNSGINVDTDAAGFVYQNNGNISNSYANILVNAAHSAGFMFSSGETGIIEDCYSLSSVRIESDAHSPFTGKKINDIEQSYNATTANISYSHYLSVDQTVKFSYENESTHEKTTYNIVLLDKFYDTNEPATSLEADEFYSYNSFQGYAFNSDFELNVDILRSVWFIPSKVTEVSVDTYNVIKENFKENYYISNRPELISANLKTFSLRVLISDFITSEKLEYEYANEDLTIGTSIRNPYLVYDATTFNRYGTEANAKNINRNYIRFISDITFEGSSITDIKAETYNINFAGDIDGNGMEINDLKLIAESETETSDIITNLGLFGSLCSIKYDDGTVFKAVVRNLNINVTSVDGTGVTYVGALAGTIEDASAFNIKVYGEGVYISGQNAVGGVVGAVFGNSELVNITSNLSVSATNKSTIGDTFNVYKVSESTSTLSSISYAGGIAGIIDVSARSEDVKTAQKYARIRKVDVYGNVTISGDIVGGAIGLINNISVVSDAHFILENNNIATPRLVAKYSAGGLVGELRGQLQRSHVVHSNQSDINEDIKNNLSSSTHQTSTSLTYNNLFNNSALATSYYIGGIAGMNLGGSISDSYSNINVINGVSKYAGGAIGLNIGGTIKSVYTTGSVYANIVGGFIGLIVNGKLINDDNSHLLSVDTLQEEGCIINNIKEISLNSTTLTMNSIVSANIWRSTDLSRLNLEKLGSFAGKLVSDDTSEFAVISTTSEMSREMSEVNVFVNTQIGSTELKEIATSNSLTVVDEDYKNLGVYGTITKENGKKYYYSRMKKYGSLRTIEEIINRNTSATISQFYEHDEGVENVSTGEFVKYNATNNVNLPKIYKGWSTIYWDGTGVNNLGDPDNDLVLPELVARPNVNVVKVYDIEDLKLIYTLLSSEFVLMNDIDLSDEIWTPVGTITDPFTGSIHSDIDSSNDYNDYILKNVTISSTDGNSVGFFGTVNGAEIHNFSINIKSIVIEKSPEYELHVGGLVGLVSDDNDEKTIINNIQVFGGQEVNVVGELAEDEDGITYNQINGIGTNLSYYDGYSIITATNIVSMGGVIGSSNNAIIDNLTAINLQIYPFDKTDGNDTPAGTDKVDSELTYNAMGGVVGYYFNNTVSSISNLYATRVMIGADKLKDSAVTLIQNFNKTTYMGGVIGYATEVYLHDVKAKDTSIYGKNIIMNDSNQLYVGGIVGLLENSIVFNATSMMEHSSFMHDIDNDISEGNKIFVEYNVNTDTYIGGGFGSFSTKNIEIALSSNFVGGIGYRTDDNPFGYISGQNYVIKTTSNAIVTDGNIVVNNKSTTANTYVGGFAGSAISVLYNIISYGEITVKALKDTYVGGLAGQIQNHNIQNAYADTNIEITTDSGTETNSKLYVGGAFGSMVSVGGLENTKQTKNVVSSGTITTLDTNYAEKYIGGFVGYAHNVGINSAIANVDIDANAKSATGILYIGGFVGYFNQTNSLVQNEYVKAFILNSYSTGLLNIKSYSYTRGGLGGFVGHVNVVSTDIDLDNTTMNSSLIKNCYSISRFVASSSNQVENYNIYYDKETKGGFIGSYNKNADQTILQNCYFNKQIFSDYENSTNELITRRYANGLPFSRNFGVGLTLEEMIYKVADKTGEEYNSQISSALCTEMNYNLSDISTTNKWTFTNNKYPLINFYLSDKIDYSEIVNNEIYEYDYSYNYNAVLDTNYEVETNGTITYSESSIYSIIQLLSNVDLGILSAQGTGTVQNPEIYNTSINLGENTDGVYTYDFTNKAVIFANDETNITISGDYGANSQVLMGATLLFKTNTINNFRITKVENSFIYGMSGTIDKSLESETDFNISEVVASALKGWDITKSTSEVDNAILISMYNNGNLEDIKITISTSSSTPLIRDIFSSGIINNIEIIGEVVSNSLIANSTYGNVYNTSVTIQNGSLIELFGGVAPNALVGNLQTYYINTKMYEYVDKSGVYSQLSVDANNYITTINENLLVGMNQKVHAIDLFTSNGTKLKSNRNIDKTIGYDFVNDWVIISGLNNNMPILRFTLKDHYATDLRVANYHITSTTPLIDETTFTVDNLDEFIQMGKTISNKTDPTVFNITLTTDIDLIGKLWTPIKVNPGVTVNFNGSGCEISNLSVLTTNADAGLFGTVYGNLTISSLVLLNGYVASALDNIVSKANAISTYYYDIDDDIAINLGYKNYSAGALIGSAKGTDSSNIKTILINKVGNQYVYVSGYNYTNVSNTFFIGGLVGSKQTSNMGIKDSYVNSPFMSPNYSAGIIYNGYVNDSYQLMMTNTYAVNHDVDNDDEMNSGYNIEYGISNSITDNGYIFNADYKSSSFNYHVHGTALTNYSTLATIFKLQTGILPEFDWASTWVRMMGINNGLPYIALHDISYWIEDGANAVNGVDYTISSNTYSILTEEGLAWVSYQSYTGNDFTGKTILLTEAEYDMADKVWTPIGHDDFTQFKGIFTALSKITIKNLQISGYFGYDNLLDEIDFENSSDSYIGLFGSINNATISNIGISNSIISGNYYVGGIAGSAYASTIENCSINDAYTSYITGNNCVGGLVGEFKGSYGSRQDSVISNSYSYAEVYGTTYIGGITGKNSGIIQISSNFGKISAENYKISTASYIGGIAGYNNGSIYEVKNTAQINARITGTDVNYVGGIVGYYESAGVSTGQIINTLNTGNVYGNVLGTVGTLIGSMSTLYSQTKTNALFNTGIKYINGVANSTYKFIGGETNTSTYYGDASTFVSSTPAYLSENKVWTISGTLSDNFSIPSSYASYYTYSNTKTISDDMGLEYALYFVNRRAYYDYENNTNQLNLTLNYKSSAYNFTNMSSNVSGAYQFSGGLKSSSSGNQRTINVAYNSTTYKSNSGALFNKLYDAEINDIIIVPSTTTYGTTTNNIVGLFAGDISNSTIINVTINGNSATLQGNANVGAMAGKLQDSTLTNSRVTSLTVTGIGNYVGGMIGEMRTSSISTSNKDTYPNNVTINSSGSSYVGGIVGGISLGTNTISNVKNIAQVSGDSNVGGILGRVASTVTISNCEVTGVTYGSQYVGGIIGRVAGVGNVNNCLVTNNINATGSNSYTGGIIGYLGGTTSLIQNNTFNATIYAYTRIGGIVGYNNGTNTISSNYMDGNIYINRSDSYNGKISSTISSFGLSFSLSYDGDVTGKFQLNYSSTTKGKENIDNVISNANAYYISNIENSNTVKNSSKITIADNYTFYYMSVSGKYHNDNGTVPLVWYEYHVGGNFSVNARYYNEQYRTFGSSYSDGVFTSAPITKGFDGTNGAVWSIGGSYNNAVNDLQSKVNGETYDFTNVTFS